MVRDPKLDPSDLQKNNGLVRDPKLDPFWDELEDMLDQWTAAHELVLCHKCSLMWLFQPTAETRSSQGMVYVTLKDKFFKPSSPERHMDVLYAACTAFLSYANPDERMMSTLNLALRNSSLSQAKMSPGMEAKKNSLSTLTAVHHNGN